jgi:hypothetical protein
MLGSNRRPPLAALPSKAEDGGPEPLPAGSPDFESGTASMTVSSSRDLPPGVNRREMAEDGVLETHPEGPPGFQPVPAA